MKVAICIMSYGRHEITAEVLAKNLNNTGLSFGTFGLFYADMVGISKACNTMLRRAYDLGYDYFVFCGNDIIEPEDWLLHRMIWHEAEHSNGRKCGMVSIPVDHVRPAASAEMVIGNFMISREVVDAVGAFDERFGEYGAVDLDYNKRCNMAGFTNYYLGGLIANHCHGHDGLELYGYLKADKVKETWHIHTSDTRGHIPLIEQQQMFGECR